jgi:(p)ppGpp synthase/HD superfamily hydrolase
VAERKEMGMQKQYNEDVEWVIRQVEQDKANEVRYPDYKERFPYEVVLVDQFQGHCEYGYDTVSRYASLEEAIASARKITEEALLRSGSVESWHGMGDAGLVYEYNGVLVWDGVREYSDSAGSAEVFRAVEFAAKAHSGQFRKKTNIPYIVHPLGVAQILMESSCPNKIVIASLLHDTIEDTAVTCQDIEENFGRYVAELVKYASEPDKQASWKARKVHTIKTLQKVPFDAALVACADKLDNIRSIRRDYGKLGEKVWEKFNASKEDQRWYYGALAEVFSGYAKGVVYAPIFAEFMSEVKAVFG